MKTLLQICLILLHSFALGQSHFGDKRFMERSIAMSADREKLANLRAELNEGLRTGRVKNPDDVTTISNAIKEMDAVLDRGEQVALFNLVPFVSFLRSSLSNAGEEPTIMPNLHNQTAMGEINYVLDPFFDSVWYGVGDVTDMQLAAMVHYYADDLGSTVEEEGHEEEGLLFAFGDRVVECLAKHQPGFIAPFYSHVVEEREYAKSHPKYAGFPYNDASVTQEQMARYEAAFSRLEALATTGKLPEVNSPAPLAASPKGDPNLPPPLKKESESQPTLTPRKKPSSATWIIPTLVAAQAAFLRCAGQVSVPPPAVFATASIVVLASRPTTIVASCFFC